MISRLDDLWIRNPAAEISHIIWKVPAAMLTPATEVRQIRGHCCPPPWCPEWDDITRSRYPGKPVGHAASLHRPAESDGFKLPLHPRIELVFGSAITQSAM